MKGLAEELELNTEVKEQKYVRKLSIVKVKKEEIIKKENKIAQVTYSVTKRFIDICAGLVGCFLLLPIIVCVKIAYLIDGDKSSIFFKQKRIGKNGEEIEMYKIRSMVLDADRLLMEMLEMNPEIREEYNKTKKLKNDPRITKIGKFIRKTSLDEFPQFINVLKGDMSLVGPRPYLPREKEDMKVYYNDIIDCKPGITGLWQVCGRSEVSFFNRCRLDGFYNKHKGVIFDLWIIIKTFITVLKKEGAI